MKLGAIRLKIDYICNCMNYIVMLPIRMSVHDPNQYYFLLLVLNVQTSPPFGYYVLFLKL